MDSIYIVSTENDCEGRTTKAIAYATGTEEDIRLFFDKSKMYNLYLREVPLVTVTAESVAEKKELLERRDRLSSERSTINDRLREIEGTLGGQ